MAKTCTMIVTGILPAHPFYVTEGGDLKGGMRGLALFSAWSFRAVAR
jgi:hypothetical protein